MTPEEFDRAVIVNLVQGDQAVLSKRQEQLVDSITDYFDTIRATYVSQGEARAFAMMINFCEDGGRK